VATDVAPRDNPTTERPKEWPAFLRRVDFWFPFAVVVAVLILSTASISGSSLAIWGPDRRYDPNALLAGRVRVIRSDEWQVTSPLKTGRVQAGFPDSRTLGLGSADLSDAWRPQIVSRSVGGALYAPFNLPLALLPVGPGFALYWWLPFMACALGMYAWLRAMRVSQGVALAASLLVTTAPAAVWWSGWLAQSIAHAAIPCALVIAATRLHARRPVLGLLAGVLAGLAAASLPWWYQPWCIPVALFSAAVTVFWGFARPAQRRSFVLVVLAAGAVFAVEEIVYLLHEGDYYRALSNTVYPGSRRERGGGISIALIFSSLFPFEIAGPEGTLIRGNSQSGTAMGWTIAAPVAIGALALGWRAIARDSERLLVMGTAAVAVVISLWVFFPWPAFLGRLTLLTFAQPERVAPFIGFFGVVMLALMLGMDERRRALQAAIGRQGALVLGAGTLLVALWGAVKFRDIYLPGLSVGRVGIATIVAGLFGALVFTRAWTAVLMLAVIASVVSGALVNPLMRGIGELEDSRAAAVVRSLDRDIVEPSGGRWAADLTFASALLNGNGVDSLSSYNDPVSATGWRVLDPRGRYEQAWNRFGYIVFHWIPGLRDPMIDTPQEDIVRVEVDPCDRRLSRLGLTTIVSSVQLSAPCLTMLALMRWKGTNLTVYARR
jgi:hypothetical protein